MSFEKAQISLNYLYHLVTKDTAELRKLSKMPKATFYRNLRNLTQQGTIKRKHGSGRPRALSCNDEIKVCRKALKSPLKSSWQITREVQTSRSINVSKSIIQVIADNTSSPLLSLATTDIFRQYPRLLVT